ncbi:MAG: folylpolyglutamate synthase/dihydrofolate synthase family protein [Bacteroidota bacterium]
MDYQSTIAWMFRQLPMYQNQGKTAYKANLDNTHKLADYLNHPERGFKSVHVAGTNGKGSTSHMMASVLQEAGYKIGLYTSPHLKDFRERIKINGEMVSEAFVIEFIEKHRAFFEANSLSFFEMTVGIAFDYFAKEEVDIAVIEVGMGGRLDSTNIITPEVSVITNIGYDHMQFLGDTIPKIAREKAGIIKTAIPIVIGEIQLESRPVFVEVAHTVSAPIYFAQSYDFQLYPSDLKGVYQRKNQRTALTALRLLKEQGWEISKGHIKNGLSQVIENTGLLGRWQVLQEHPKVICDTAHNREGLVLTLNQLESETFQQLHIILGVVKDKDLDAILPLFPITAIYYFCKPEVMRGLDAEVLHAAAQRHGLQGKAYKSVKAALDAAKTEALEDDVIYVGGSTFVVAEII